MKSYEFCQKGGCSAKLCLGGAWEKLTLLAMVEDFVFGHASREAAERTAVNTEFAAAQLRSGAFLRLVRCSAINRSLRRKIAWGWGCEDCSA